MCVCVCESDCTCRAACVLEKRQKPDARAIFILFSFSTLTHCRSLSAHVAWTVPLPSLSTSCRHARVLAMACVCVCVCVCERVDRRPSLDLDAGVGCRRSFIHEPRCLSVPKCASVCHSSIIRQQLPDLPSVTTDMSQRLTPVTAAHAQGKERETRELFRNDMHVARCRRHRLVRHMPGRETKALGILLPLSSPLSSLALSFPFIVIAVSSPFLFTSRRRV